MNDEFSAVDVSKANETTSEPVVNTNVGGGSGGYRIRRLRCCTRDGGWLALRSLPAGAASKHRALRPLRRFVVSGTEKARCQRVSWGPCEHERGKRGNDGRSWRSRGLRCWTSDGGCLALRSRRADGGSKPPRGALVNDRRLERRGKRRGCDRVRCGPGR